MPWKEFIAEHNNSLANLLNRIAHDAQSANFDRLKTFLEYYKEPTVREDVDRKWRDKSNGKKHGQVVAGKHEWIPTNMLPYMLTMAAGWEDVRWLIGMEVLRTPCATLIYRGYIRKTPKPNPHHPEKQLAYASPLKLKTGTTVSEIADLQAHVGSLYRNNGVKIAACQVGMPTWHRHLREIIYRRLNDHTNDLQGFTHELVQFIGGTIWQGNIEQLANFAEEPIGVLKANAAKIACDYYSDRKGTAWGGCTTLADMAMRQTENFMQFKAILFNQFLALLKCPPPGRDSFNTAVHVDMLVDDGLPSDEDNQDESEG